jgi:uncharacterized membrane protein YoaK (UPF0700 family)
MGINAMKLPSLPTLLSFNGGYVDTLGFLALSGLFTAHVTGNFVTLSAAAVFGLSGALSKLLALPVFCLVVFASHAICRKLQACDRSPIRPMLLVKLVLLTAVAIFAYRYGPIRSDENGATLALGMTLVSAMAIQNGLHKAHLAKAPPSTLMTGTTTQIMLDLADLFVDTNPDEVAAARARIGKMAAAVLAFVIGCSSAAVTYLAAPVVAFAVPAVIAAIALFADSAGAQT